MLSLDDSLHECHALVLAGFGLQLGKHTIDELRGNLSPNCVWIVDLSKQKYLVIDGWIMSNPGCVKNR